MRLTGSRNTRKTERLSEKGSDPLLKCWISRIFQGSVPQLVGSLTPFRTASDDGSPGDLNGAGWSWLLGRAGWLALLATRLHIRHNTIPGAPLPARPSLLVLITILLVGLCATLAGWGSKARFDSSEVALRTDLLSSNLNNTRAEACQDLAPAPGPINEDKSIAGKIRLLSAVQPDLEPPAGPTAAPQSVIAVPDLPALDAPRAFAAVPQQSPWSSAVVKRVQHKGDNLMMRTWNWNAIGFKAFLVAALAAGPSHAEQTSNPASDSEKFEAIQKQLDGLKKQLDEMQALLSGVTKVGKNIEDVRAELIASMQEAQRQIKDQIDQLKADVSALRARDTGAARISAFPPGDSAAPGGTGRVQITNSYNSPIAVRVNQIVYHVPPSQTVTTADIPSGRFTYEVLGVTEPRERSLAATKVFPIHVHPQW